jgi:hypothetical protein
MTLDAQSGLLTWVPTLADLGYAYPVIAVTNAIGTVDLYPSIPVVFAATVTNVAASGSLSTGLIDVSWTDPTFAAEPIAGYNIYLSWIDSMGNFWTTGATFVAFGSTSTSLPAWPGVMTFLVFVVAADANGNEGAYPDSGTSVTLV